MIKVWATSEEAVAMLSHPACPTRFVDINTPVEWPNDQFTFRRLTDGDISTGAPAEEARKPVASQHVSAHKNSNRSAD